MVTWGHTSLRQAGDAAATLGGASGFPEDSQPDQCFLQLHPSPSPMAPLGHCFPPQDWPLHPEPPSRPRGLPTSSPSAPPPAQDTSAQGPS